MEVGSDTPYLDSRTGKTRVSAQEVVTGSIVSFVRDDKRYLAFAVRALFSPSALVIVSAERRDELRSVATIWHNGWIDQIAVDGDYLVAGANAHIGEPTAGGLDMALIAIDLTKLNGVSDLRVVLPADPVDGFVPNSLVALFARVRRDPVADSAIDSVRVSDGTITVLMLSGLTYTLSVEPPSLAGRRP